MGCICFRGLEEQYEYIIKVGSVEKEINLRLDKNRKQM